MHPQALIVKSHEIPPLEVLGTQVRFLVEAQRTSGAWSLMEVAIPLNSGPPAHNHSWDEAYFITEGTVEFTVGGKQFTATAGDFIYTPGGVAHGFRGTSAQPAHMLIFDAPAHAAAFFKQVDREVRDLPRDLPKVLEIGKNTGIHFLQPE